MSKPANSQSQKRFAESVGALFQAPPSKTPTSLFLTSSTDEGVVRNGGRNGARFAPRSLLATFKRLTQTENLRGLSFRAVEVSSPEAEEVDFPRAQELEAGRIREALETFPGARIFHVGGGHDHIYPLLMALREPGRDLVVINIDAHADTRTDESFHSGTPFRQFAGQHREGFRLFQIGLNPFANSFSTLESLEPSHQSVLWRRDLTPEKLSAFFQSIKEVLKPKTRVVFSLDADALNAAEVPGVSAVNSQGLCLREVLDLWRRYVALGFDHQPVMGIYELNPVYDTLASISMRTISTLIFESLND